ncbi:conserved hypothetical protein [Ricinus communis]|uniref:Uncharacterized protein n=1 Tax=Ricinus communis TaxID=3988 RepID=B9R9Y9_RICCO|nr:conserved hypothetical protein [Ricinus communis]
MEMIAFLRSKGAMQDFGGRDGVIYRERVEDRSQEDWHVLKREEARVEEVAMQGLHANEVVPF